MSSEPAKPQTGLKAGEFLESARQRWAWFRQKLAIWLEPDNLQQLRPQVKFQAGVLAGFALLAAILLGVADLATRGVIELRLREDLQANLAQVVPAELHDNDLLQDSVMLDARDNNLGSEQIEVYLAKQAGMVNAVCFKFVAPDGYAGPITLVMGVDRNGEILGVRVISHVETPGLGDKIEVTKSKWVLGFNGKSLDNLSVEQWAVKKDGGVFDQFSGATITPRKVVQAIKRGLDFYKSHQAELLGAG
ncbi:electron transport complex subunit RsxG [Methylomonas koyamae]|uniref:electron transport complex subunit RsxG n=1 Tax=Methylomonas koyamae TaxID=702114 RepID=UPI00112EA136|nr:electron transport complex subunit RsxG [Methylomonas koyamae]TPQ26878.1 electron transport complex subunit RsxG [Methylomonas koyamae]